jgi:cardiolipin synthase
MDGPLAVLGLHAAWYTAALALVEALMRIGIGLRVLMRRLPVGVTLSWLLVVLTFPIIGPLLYLLIGELRLGDRRARRAAIVHQPFLAWLRGLDRRHTVDWATEGLQGEPVSKLVERIVGLPALPGNALELIHDTDAILHRLIADIEAAQSTCHLAFYIWHPGGLADEVEAALIRAAERGVRCRVLLDAVGSHGFLASHHAARLRDAGVEVRPALDVGLVRMLFVRFDIRLHRKIVVIDGQVAYTGSLNLVDPRYFKQSSHVGEWVDAMVRLTGPAVEALAVTFLEDWALESSTSIEEIKATGDVHPIESTGSSIVQVFPSGPMHVATAIESVLMYAIYTAQNELVLTTPYFVPDDPMRTALIAAALRGVEVTLVLPARVDSRLVGLVSESDKGDLAAAGVRVMLFEGGLLHTKSVTVDRQFSLFGSLNLDPRSLHLNFEITLLSYDPTFTGRLRHLQQTYIEKSRPLDLEIWRRRPAGRRLIENVARILSPLL